MTKGRRRIESASDIDQPGDAADHRDRVAMRAYELYLARGGGDGRDFEDWLDAEREITGGVMIDMASRRDADE